MGWESLQEIVDHSKEQKQATDIATAYFNAFNTEAGKFVLDNMIETFLTKPIVRSGEDAYAQGIRQGSANVVYQIIQQLEYANNPKQEAKRGIAQRIKRVLFKFKR